MKKYLVFTWLIILLIAVSGIFWYSELRYSLPTPVPAGYHDVARGTKINLPSAIFANRKQAVLLHFFNPDCPCSRFNLDHIKSLINQYGNTVSFAMVLVTNKNYSEKEIQDRFGVSIPVLKDSLLAKACGVYSTPQAVILDNEDHLFYRGNYNRSRYCTDAKTNYAQNALVALLSKNYQVSFGLPALTAYGCQLPNCNSQ